MIALLEVSAQMGDRVGFTNWKRQIGAIADDLPKERQVLFHLQLGVGYTGFGQLRNAERSLRKAVAVAERHHLNEYTFRAEAALRAMRDQSAPDTPVAPVTSGAEGSTEFDTIAEKLRALRAG